MTTPPEFFSPKFHYTFGDHEPMLRVGSGESLCVVCPDSDNGLSDGSVLPDERRQSPSGSDLFEGNPVGGPIYVEGIETGDALAVDIDAIELDRRTGQTLLAPGHGLLSSDQLVRPDELFSSDKHCAHDPVPQHLYQWAIDPANQTATITNPLGDDTITVPLRPIVGTLGVCPPWGQNVSTLMADVHGGNMDLPVLGAGTTIILPVFCPGGLLMLGDLHAAQGHGEIIGGGIETSGRVTITVRGLTDLAADVPVLLTGDAIYTVATHGDLRTAISTSYAHLVHWLAAELQLNRWDGYQLLSQTGSVSIGGMTARANNTVAAGIPTAVLPAHVQAKIDQFRNKR